MADLSTSFANEYISKGYLDRDRKLLFVKAAIGGSGFTRNLQGIGKPIYKRMLDMVNYALSLNKNNRIIAFLWHQGEHDAFENRGKSPNYIYNYYKKEFSLQTKDFLKTFNISSIPVITGGFTRSKEHCQYLQDYLAVENALKDSKVDFEKFAFVDLSDLHSNAQDIVGNNDDLHFSMKSQREIGKRYFEAFDLLMKEVA